MKKYDYIIVGAGLYGAMYAFKMASQGKKCLVVEKSSYVGGYCHTDEVNGITVHSYGAHIFRTNEKRVWDFVNSICEFVPFVNTPIAKFGHEVYNMPFNMNTFCKLWDVVTPEEAKKKIEETAIKCEDPKNLEEFVLSEVGEEIYEKFIKHYTEKQWGKSCKELPVSTMSRIPIRFTFDNNYFREMYQGIPKEGYTVFIERLLADADVILGTDYLRLKSVLDSLGERIVYTGPIDEFFGYKFGKLEYRSVTFDTKYYEDIDNLQGVAVVNYTSDEVPYTRTIEHKHFVHKTCKGTVVSTETPVSYEENSSPTYPILTERNIELYNRYKEEAEKIKDKVEFGGRLGEYRYYSMNDIIEKFV